MPSSELAFSVKHLHQHLDDGFPMTVNYVHQCGNAGGKTLFSGANFNPAQRQPKPALEHSKAAARCALDGGSLRCDTRPGGHDHQQQFDTDDQRQVVANASTDTNNGTANYDLASNIASGVCRSRMTRPVGRGARGSGHPRVRRNWSVPAALPADRRYS